MALSFAQGETKFLPSGGQNAEDPSDQVPPALRRAPLVPGLPAAGVGGAGAQAQRLPGPEPDLVGQLLAHGLGGRQVTRREPWQGPELQQSGSEGCWQEPCPRSLDALLGPSRALVVLRSSACCLWLGLILEKDSVVAGGGAIEMELSKYLQDYSRTTPGKQQLLIGAYAKALEIVPQQLCDDAGFDATNILNKLRAKHAQGGLWYGVDVNNEDTANNFEAFVWEPAVVHISALTAASEAACLIVSVDETIKNPRATVDASPAMRGSGRGRPHNH